MVVVPPMLPPVLSFSNNNSNNNNSKIISITHPLRVLLLLLFLLSSSWPIRLGVGGGPRSLMVVVEARLHDNDDIHDDIDDNDKNNHKNPHKYSIGIGTGKTTGVHFDNSKIWRFPLHQISGTQHINVYIGQPPTRQTWIVDTGSRFTVTFCGAYCPNCGRSSSTSTTTSGNINNNNKKNQVYRGSSTNRLVPCGQCQMKANCEFLQKIQEQRALLSESFSSSSSSSSSSGSVTTHPMDVPLFCKVKQQYTEGSKWTAWEVNDIIALEGAELVVGGGHDLMNRNTNLAQTENKHLEGGYYGSTQNDKNSNHKNNNRNKNKSPHDSHRHGSTSNEDGTIVWDMAVPLSFGCQTEIRGLFRKQYADGILGLEHSDYSIVSIWQRQGLIPNNNNNNNNQNQDVQDVHSNNNQDTRASFRLCLHPFGGWFSVGYPPDHDTVTMQPQTRLQYTTSSSMATPLTTTTTTTRNRPANKKRWYNVLVESVWLGTQLLADIHHNATANIIHSFRKDKGTILDSGTTDTFLPAALSNVFSQAWQEQMGQPFRRRMNDYTWLQFQQLPDIQLVLVANVTWTLRPRYYMEGVVLTTRPISMTTTNTTSMNDDDDDDDGLVVHPWSGTKTLTNRIYLDEPMGAVLGLNAMMGYEIEYNHNQPTRGIGIAPANCHV